MPRLRALTSISSSEINTSTTSHAKKDITLTYSYTLAVNQIIQCILNHLGQVVRQMLMADIMQVVIVGVLGHTTIEVRPGQDILKVDLSQQRIKAEMV